MRQRASYFIHITDIRLYSTTFKMECVSKPSKNEDADWYYNYARQCADNVHRYIHR